jgi:hypothetical protein
MYLASSHETLGGVPLLFIDRAWKQRQHYRRNWCNPIYTMAFISLSSGEWSVRQQSPTLPQAYRFSNHNGPKSSQQSVLSLIVFVSVIFEPECLSRTLEAPAGIITVSGVHSFSPDFMLEHKANKLTLWSLYLLENPPVAQLLMNFSIY